MWKRLIRAFSVFATAILWIQIYNNRLVECAKLQENNGNDTLSQANGHRIVCYYDSRYIEQKESFVLSPVFTDPTLCTHLIYAFGKINGSKVSTSLNFQYSDPQTQDADILGETVALKSRNKDLKVLLSIGGWTFNSKEFQRTVNNETSRRMLINNIIDVLAKYKFDGLDIYTENPANRGDIIYQESKEYMILLCQELRKAFVPFNYMLTAALPGNLKVVPGSSDVMIELAQSLDFITIIAFDLHGAWENVTMHHAPLYANSIDSDKQPTSIDDVVQQWLKTRIPRNKLLLGLSTHGRSFVPRNGNDRCPLTNSPILCITPPEILTFTEGLMAYGEVCFKLRKEKWTYKWLDIEQVPIAFSTDNNIEPFIKWVGFDDVRSFDIKVKYLMKVGLGGATLFTLDNDDFIGFCKQTTFPLLRVINYYLNKNRRVKFPDPDIPFNLTHYQLQSVQNQSNLQKYFSSFNNSDNNTEVIELFCDCKKGIHHVTVNQQQNNTKSLIMIDCDNKEIVNKRNINKVKDDQLNQFFVDPMIHKHQARISSSLNKEFQRTVNNQTSRRMLISSILDVLAKYKFDGLDIYTENPANRGDIIYQESKEYMILLCQELRKAFVPFNYMLTAALPGNLRAVPGSSDVMVDLAKSLDFITIIAYDLHGAWENVTVHHAPLYTRSKDTESEKLISIDDIVQQWLRTEIPRDKLLLGLSAHGRSFVPKNQDDRCPLTNSPILCMTPPERISLTEGVMEKKKWIYKWLDVEQVPIAFSTDNDIEPFKKWVGFDDVRSIDIKVKYLMKAGLGGAMLFSLDNEDFLDFCKQKSYPLLRVINRYLNKKIKVKYPDPDAPYNLTRYNLQTLQSESYLLRYFNSFNRSANKTEAMALFCDCKKGIHPVMINRQQNKTKSVIMIDCDRNQIVDKSSIHPVKEDKLNEFFVDPMIRKQQTKISHSLDSDFIKSNGYQHSKLNNHTLIFLFAAMIFLVRYSV